VFYGLVGFVDFSVSLGLIAILSRPVLINYTWNPDLVLFLSIHNKCLKISVLKNIIRTFVGMPSLVF
jgi:hypothetical protein